MSSVCREEGVSDERNTKYSRERRLCADYARLIADHSSANSDRVSSVFSNTQETISRYKRVVHYWKKNEKNKNERKEERSACPRTEEENEKKSDTVLLHISRIRFN